MRHRIEPSNADARPGRAAPIPQSLLLWVGPKHSGKTTAAAHLAQAARSRGFAVAGCLAPAIYMEGRLVGFDIVDLRSGARRRLAQRESAPGVVRGFRFTAEGLALGREALRPRFARDADLVIVDEYGPLELDSRGWRAATDRLIRSTGTTLLLVVREELAETVRRLYAGIVAATLIAAERGSTGEVLKVLENRRRAAPYK